MTAQADSGTKDGKKGVLAKVGGRGFDSCGNNFSDGEKLREKHFDHPAARLALSGIIIV